MILGIASAVVYVLTVLLFLVNRLHFPPAIRMALARLHKPLGLLFLVLSAIHLALGLKLFHQRPLAIFILGAAIVALAAGEVITSQIKTQGSMRSHRLLALLIIPLLAAHVAVCLSSFHDYQKKVAAIAIADVDSSMVPDGTYTGTCDVGYIYAKVGVTVENGTITSIDLLEHRNERGTPGEAVIGEILAEQRMDVDAVSGATNSSNVIKKAVQNALASAKANP